MLFKLFCVFSLVLIFSLETEDAVADVECASSVQVRCVKPDAGYQLYRSYRRYLNELGVFFVPFELLRHCEAERGDVPHFLKRCLPLMRR